MQKQELIIQRYVDAVKSKVPILRFLHVSNVKFLPMHYNNLRDKFFSGGAIRPEINQILCSTNELLYYKNDPSSMYFYYSKFGYLGCRYFNPTNCCAIHSIGNIIFYPNMDFKLDTEENLKVLQEFCVLCTENINHRVNSGMLLGADVIYDQSPVNGFNLGGAYDTRVFFELSGWETSGEVFRNTNTNNYIQTWFLYKTERKEVSFTNYKPLELNKE